MILHTVQNVSPFLPCPHALNSIALRVRILSCWPQNQGFKKAQSHGVSVFEQTRLRKGAGAVIHSPRTEVLATPPCALCVLARGEGGVLKQTHDSKLAGQTSQMVWSPKQAFSGTMQLLH